MPEADELIFRAAMLPTWWVYLFAFVFGSLWGSFFNVAIYRWPRDMSVVTPGSHCPQCGAAIPAIRNIPILAWVLQKGRTACCNKPYSGRYAAVELLSGVLALAIAHRFIVTVPNAPAGPAVVVAVLYFAFTGGLLVATFADLETLLIPDEVSLLGLAVGAVTASVRGMPVEDALFGIGASFLVTQGLFVWGWQLLTGRPGWGEGDPKFLMFIAAFLGWKGAAFAVVFGALQGLVFYAIARATKFQFVQLDASLFADDEPDPVTFASGYSAAETASAASALGAQAASNEAPIMPFGPCLALAALEYLFFGARINAWFEALFTA